jgi:hypothetical protein
MLFGQKDIDFEITKSEKCYTKDDKQYVEINFPFGMKSTDYHHGLSNKLKDYKYY